MKKCKIPALTQIVLGIEDTLENVREDEDFSAASTMRLMFQAIFHSVMRRVSEEKLTPIL